MISAAAQSFIAADSISSAQHTPKKLHQINPIEDRRWSALVQHNPRSSVFHSVAWLQSLRQTYGYKPLAFTWSEPGEELRNAVLFCEVDSWLTGRRLVSLPFSDHCEPLLDDTARSRDLLAALQEQSLASRWRYLEVRPIGPEDGPGPDWRVSAKYTFHRLNLRPDLPTLFCNFHRSSTQRKILRAKREGVVYCEGSNESFLNDFYRLLVVTRKRHHIPPQPRLWFRNLMENFGSALKIRIAFKNSQPLAAMLTIRHKETLFYKYGGSDARFHSVGGMHLLYWNAIQDAKRSGLTALDFGRSDVDQMGLITYKSRWGAACSTLEYYRFARHGNPIHAFDATDGMKRRAIQQLCSLAPESLLPYCGDLLYKHIG